MTMARYAGRSLTSYGKCAQRRKRHLLKPSDKQLLEP